MHITYGRRGANEKKILSFLEHAKQGYHKNNDEKND